MAAPNADAPVVLVVDDEPGLRDVLQVTLRRQGYRTVTSSGVAAAIHEIETRAEPFPLVLTDLLMPDGSGMEVLQAAHGRSRHTQVIVITAFSTVERAIEAMRKGAYDFVAKPFSPAELAVLAGKALEKSLIIAENERLRAAIGSDAADDPTAAFGRSAAMRRVANLVTKAASTRSTVLITGESGTGKELVARSLHELSDRAAEPFCVLNCGALPEALMESELFGHEKGAFTGAATASRGMFRQADGGTLLLDEVGELPAPLQVKLLRVLQERKVRPVGSPTEVAVDVRLLAATNRDVEADVAAGQFRQDLYYRLNVIRVEVPPLRDREGDARRLAAHMVTRFAAEMGKGVRDLSSEALRALDDYAYPGNVRELENMMERAVALATGSLIDLEDLPEAVSGLPIEPVRHAAELPPGGCNLERVLEQTERTLIERALAQTNGVRKSAARSLGISFRSLRYRLAKLDIDVDDAADKGEPAP